MNRGMSSSQISNVLGRLEYYESLFGMLTGMRGVVLKGRERDVLIAMAHFGGNKMDGVARKVLMNRGMSSSQISNVLGRLEYYESLFGMLTGMRGVVLKGRERDVLIAMAHFGGNKMDGVARKVLMNRGMSSSQISNVLGSLRLKGIVSGSGKLSELTSFYKLSRDGMGFEISFEVDSQKQ